ncbi:class III extradiol ring-cleavage dioxygenase [Rheinheimera sp.]|uniref:DODA-type extradiol aromatic ring-opening family dioxygenase n=1 Tax=Rheinheimera sp. TaxID=1869214 RepID=UPI0027326B11|nr:class III extradiol ring-cleavage dioxygenase [Rheinheimera sp.]MDP2713698.1 class III extradiol ring-cleavage dioxygenase [Rheinheimera sp.]
MTSSLAPVLYLPHGGGPLPLLGDPDHRALTQFLTQLGDKLATPAAILVISAHWESPQPALTAAENPSLLFDYSGFPAQSYQLSYPAPGAPQLAVQIAEQLQQAGFAAELNPGRGWDHGVFVPLLLLRPQADIPVLQLSLLKGLDAKTHIALGEAISFLRQQNVLIIGSGMSFHNMQAFFNANLVSDSQLEAFNQYFIDSLQPQYSYAEQAKRLINWQQAPDARLMHPREEHLLPLHVCFGAAKGSTAQVLFNNKVLHKTVLAFGW